MARLAPDGFREEERDGQWEEPPCRDALVLEKPGEPEGDSEAGRNPPVVTDDEVPPEAPE